MTTNGPELASWQRAGIVALANEARSIARAIDSDRGDDAPTELRTATTATDGEPRVEQLAAIVDLATTWVDRFSRHGNPVIVERIARIGREARALGDVVRNGAL